MWYPVIPVVTENKKNCSEKRSSEKEGVKQKPQHPEFDLGHHEVMMGFMLKKHFPLALFTEKTWKQCPLDNNEHLWSPEGGL